MEIKFNLYCLDSSEQMEFESESRGFRGDIYVEIEKNIFQLNVYDIVRLKQDFEEENEEYGYFAIENNVVIVKKVNKVEIKNLIGNLIKQKYFNKVQPVDDGTLSKISLTTF